MKVSIPTPSITTVQSYLTKWKTLDKYVHQEEALNHLFQKLCPSNSDLLSVLLKVSALNDFYTTNIYDTHSVAAHILTLNCDHRIKAGDGSLVNEMALVKVGKTERNFFSFASKYCNHHHQEPFPIFDSYVERMLWHFQGVDQFATFKRPELRRYSRFVELIGGFRTYYGLVQFSLREIDIYLWLAGKEAFGILGQKKQSHLSGHKIRTHPAESQHS